jgi:hypothetical protein
MEIHITWCTQDVMETAKSMEVKLTEDEANDVLGTVEHNHDACHGISWDNIEWAIGDLVDQRDYAYKN